MSSQQLAQLIDAKLQVLRQLRSVSERQLAVVSEDDLSSLLTVLAAKQKVLEVLNQLDQQLAPFRAEDPEMRRWSSSSERQRCREQAARCEAELKEILGVERQAEEAMRQRQQAVAAKLQHLDRNAAAGLAYLQSPALPGTAYELSAEG